MRSLSHFITAFAGVALSGFTFFGTGSVRAAPAIGSPAGAAAAMFASAASRTASVSAAAETSPLSPNQWNLEGLWVAGSEYATLTGRSGGIRYRFHARDLQLVMAPADKGRPTRFRVLLDGLPPGPDHGTDIDSEGWGNLKEERLYQLVRQSGAVADRTLEIDFYDAGVSAYSFTFS